MLLAGACPRSHLQPLLPTCALHSLPVRPQMLGSEKSTFAVTVEKTEFLQSGTVTPRLATVPPTLPPLPLANKWGCTFAEPLFGVSMVGGKGLATPDQESSTSVCQDHGQPECTEELLRARHVWARPAPAGGFRAEPSWRCGFLLQGQPAPASSHCLGWWSRGGKLKARRCHHQGSRWDTGILEVSHCHR